jgi:hypothetical protein
MHAWLRVTYFHDIKSENQMGAKAIAFNRSLKRSRTSTTPKQETTGPHHQPGYPIPAITQNSRQLCSSFPMEPQDFYRKKELRTSARVPSIETSNVNANVFVQARQKSVES